MKVSQLIEALSHMPPDAEVSTHAVNHSNGDGAMRVALAKRGYDAREQVIIGDWSEYNLAGWMLFPGNGPRPVEPIYAVRTWGDEKGQLVTETMHEFDDQKKPNGKRWELKTEADKAEDIQREEQRARNLELQERRQLERLKAKYEGGP